MAKIICRRLRRGQDLLAAIKAIAEEENLLGAVVLSAVGCLSRARLRDATGVNIQEIDRHLEIVSLTGTVSKARCHLHISLSGEDLQTIGGHLVPGCMVNTTCELVLMETGWIYGKEDDPETGYREIVFMEANP